MNEINGKPALACFTKISELDSDSITVEPMDNYPVVRDLAVNFDRMISNHKKVMPYVIREDSEIDAESGVREFLQSPEMLKNTFNFQVVSNVDYVIACPTMAMDKTFVGPQALAQLTIHADSREKTNGSKLLMSHMESGDVTLRVLVVKFVQKELILQWEFSFERISSRIREINLLVRIWAIIYLLLICSAINDLRH